MDSGSRRIAYFNCPTGIAGDMALAALVDAGAPAKDIIAGLNTLGGINGEWSLRFQRVEKGNGRISALKAYIGIHSHCHTSEEVYDESMHRQTDGDLDRKGQGAYHDSVGSLHLDHGHGHGHGHGHSHGDGYSGNAKRTESYTESRDKHRSFADIQAMIKASSLPASVKRDSILVFRKLAEAEGSIHNVLPESVHFHEVGAVDSIVDTVGVVLALHLLGVDDVYVSELPLSQGVVESQHGFLPVPAPATTKVLSNTGVVFRPSALRGELVTPTGASILAALCSDNGFCLPPRFQVDAYGRGAGMKDFDEHPNVLHVTLGNTTPPSLDFPVQVPRFSSLYATDELVQLECNIDDMEGEIIGYAQECLMSKEACLDCWLVPIQMKKNRPAFTLCAICHRQNADELCSVMFEETSTLGIRRIPCSRVRLDRRFEEVTTRFGSVMVKLGVDPSKGRIVNASPEYEDCRKLALTSGAPLKLIYAEAKGAASAFFSYGGNNATNSTNTAVREAASSVSGVNHSVSSQSSTHASSPSKFSPNLSKKKAAEAEDCDTGYRNRIALFEKRMRASFLDSLSSRDSGMSIHNLKNP